MLQQDSRYGFRLLARSPGFSLFVVLVVAVGVGGSTTVFNVVNAFLPRPLPYHEPDQSAVLRQRSLQGRGSDLSYPNYLDWRREAQSFEGLGCYFFDSFPVNVPGADLPEMCPVGLVSSTFFQVLGVAPCLGPNDLRGRLALADCRGLLGQLSPRPPGGAGGSDGGVEMRMRQAVS